MRKLLQKIYQVMKDENCTDEEHKILEYFFVGCSFEIIKAILIMIILIGTGYFKEGIIVCLVMFTSKPFIGGYHEETQITCFISTVMAIFFIIAISMNSSLTFIGNMMMIILSVFCIWNRAPVIDSKMPLTKSHLIIRNRIIGTSILSIFGIISILIYNHTQFYRLITWTVIFQALLLFRRNIKLR